jgi:cytochrome c oxidase assembly factor CtaG
MAPPAGWPGTARPEIWVPLLVLATAYGAGWWRLSRRGRHLAPWRPALALLGLGSLAGALSPPLDALAHRLFAAHMAQHMLLVALAAPAILLADPFPALLWALPAGARRRVGLLLIRGAPGRRICRAVTRTPVAWLTYAAVLWVWHLPPAYDAALRSPLLHDLEHLAFFTSAILFWWPVINPAPRVAAALHPSRRVVYLVAGALQSATLGLLLAASPTVIYASYRSPLGPWPLSPLDDQALGGVVMWGVSGAVDMLAVLLLLHRYFSLDEIPGRPATSRPRDPRADAAPLP